MRSAERSGNELFHADWRDYDYECDSLLYSRKSARNSEGQTRAAAATPRSPRAWSGRFTAKQRLSTSTDPLPAPLQCS